MIEARLLKEYPSRPGSAGFTLDLEFSAGAGVTVLFGPSGSGKTLTLDLVAGFVRPTSGRITLDGQVIHDSNSRISLPPRRRGCGYVFQNYALFPHLTLRQNLEFAAECWPRPERSRRIERILDQFRLTEVAGRKPRELSGGQKQRCSIARAILTEPRILLLDEPAPGLDVALKLELYQAIGQVREQFRTPVLLVSHDLDECLSLGTEMLMLRNGRVIGRGEPRKLIEEPPSLEAARMLGIFSLHRAPGESDWLCVRRSAILAVPGVHPIGENQLALRWIRAMERAADVLVEFEGGIAAEVPHATFAAGKQQPVWTLTLPKDARRVL